MLLKKPFIIKTIQQVNKREQNKRATACNYNTGQCQCQLYEKIPSALQLQMWQQVMGHMIFNVVDPEDQLTESDAPRRLFGLAQSACIIFEVQI